MALPPEPIEEVMPQAKWVVEAEVAEVLSTGAAPPKINAPPGATSVGSKAASQSLKLTIKRALRGDTLAELVVEKPEAGYSLSKGNKGTFLIDANKRILGRYGPDSWSTSKIEGAVKGA